MRNGPRILKEQQVTQQNQPPTRDRQAEIAAAAQNTQRTVSQAAESIHALRTESDRASSLLGFGRRIWVPADEVHVVVGHGFHITRSAREAKVYGQAAGESSQYWLNTRTKVIKLKTISFTVPLHGFDGMGIEALDANKVSFRLWAHAVAQLNPSRADVAARRIGQDTEGLVRTITQVAMSELIEAAAQLELNQIIANRQELARQAFGNVNTALSELGYDLSVLTVTRLAGDAYAKLVTQAESRISKETTITINREQLAEKEDVELREQREAQIEAETQQEKAAVEAVTTEKLVATERAKQKAMLEKVGLDKELSAAEAEKNASLQRKQAEYTAQIRALEQQKELELTIARSEADADRIALEQVKKIERDAELTEAEAERLRRQELAAAERAKEVALVKENEVAESYEIQAQAEARALDVKVEAETRAELARAEAEARSTEQRAIAAKTRAEATRAETAAAGLAEAEVAEAQVRVSEQKVAVGRAEGLAEAEIAQAKAEAEALREQKLREIEISAQRQLAKLYQDAPVLVDLEKARLAYAHKTRLAEIQADASIRAFEAIAPGIKINVVGNGGQIGSIMSNVLTLSHSINAVGDEIPAVGRLLEGDQGSDGFVSLLPHWTTLMPSMESIMTEMKPRAFSSLTVADMVERLGPVVAGQDDLVTALMKLKGDANFRLVGNMPIRSVLGLFGVKSEQPTEEIIITDES